jgi:hypothetical protein
MLGLSSALGEEAAVAAIGSEVPVAMRKVFRRLERWRRQRQGRERIPQHLWIVAGELAREHGVNPVSRVLSLEFNRLKRMAESNHSAAAPSKHRVKPSFVELIAPQVAISPLCVIELEGQRGKMRIEWKGTTADLASLSQSLWEMIV